MNSYFKCLQLFSNVFGDGWQEPALAHTITKIPQEKSCKNVYVFIVTCTVYKDLKKKLNKKFEKEKLC